MERAPGCQLPPSSLPQAVDREPGEGIPKQYRPLQGRPVLARTLAAFVAHPRIGRTIVVIHPDDRDLYEATLSALPAASSTVLPCVHGGETRQDSVRSGLEALVDLAPDIVLIHDAARPFAGPDLIDRAIQAAERWGSAVPGTPVTDTIKVIGERSQVLSTPDRSALRAVQTPQAFRFPLLLEAHRRAAAANLHAFTDDGALVGMGRSAGACVRGRSRQHQAHPSGRFRGGGAAHERRDDDLCDPPRHGLRRARLRRWRSRVARRGERSA